jgi:hypothetical protein
LALREEKEELDWIFRSLYRLTHITFLEGQMKGNWINPFHFHRAQLSIVTSAVFMSLEGALNSSNLSVESKLSSIKSNPDVVFHAFRYELWLIELDLRYPCQIECDFVTGVQC